MQTDDFEDLVAAALDDLPPEFSCLLDNVAVFVEDEPDPDVLKELGVQDLLGLYRGVPLPEREGAGLSLPDEVVLYRRPIMRRCGDDRERLAAEVRDTLVHELGHHFGLDDADMPF